jgi:cytochrome c
MKIVGVSAVFLFLLLFSSPSWANDLGNLINANGCYACHSVDQKLVGPSFKMVADRYRGQNNADEMLAKKIIAGGSGNWDKITGGVVMPPHPDMSPGKAKEIADWILSLK